MTYILYYKMVLFIVHLYIYIWFRACLIVCVYLTKFTPLVKVWIIYEQKPTIYAYFKRKNIQRFGNCNSIIYVLSQILKF